MPEDNKTQNIPYGLLVFRKACRLLAGICLIFFIVFFAAAIIDLIKDSENIDVSIIGIFAICIPAYLFRKIPDWIISFYQTRFLQASDDHTKKIKIKKAVIGQNIFEHAEVTDKNSREKYITEDRQGRVIFDSTTRPLRLIFGGAFLVIGLIIGGLIFHFSDNIGCFEYIWLGGWIIFCLAAMGFVYEVTINKSLGIADRKAGWFIFVFKRRFNLTDFSKVIVGSTFYRQRYDTLRDRYRSEDPKFSVNLSGRKELNLRVLSSLTYARHMGEEVSEYLKLPLEEKSDLT